MISTSFYTSSTPTCKITLYLVLLLTILLIFLMFSNEIKGVFKEFVENMMKLPLFINISLLTIAGILIILIGLPISYYEFLLGLTIDEISVAFLIDFLIKIIGTMMTFIISQKFLKTRILKKYKNKPFFKNLKVFVESRQCLHLLLIRLLFIPIFVKNYLLPLFDISTMVYFLTTIPVDVAAGFWLVYLGFGVKNLSKNFGDSYESLRFIGVLAISFSFLAYFLYFTRKKLKELEALPIKQEENKDFKENS